MATYLAQAMVIAIAAQASAAPVQVSFSGHTTNTYTGASEFFDIGAMITGVFIYESSVPKELPDIGNSFAPFLYPDHGFVTIGGYTAQFRNDGFAIVNDDVILNLPHPTVVDQLTIAPLADGLSLDGRLRPLRFGFNLWDTTASFFDGSTLPTTLPPPSSFPSLPIGLATANWYFAFVHPEWEIYAGGIEGNLTSWEVTIVPEPATLLLWLSASATLAILPGLDTTWLRQKR